MMARQEPGAPVPRGAGRPGRSLVRWDVREAAIVLGPAVLLIGLSLWLLVRLVQPSPPTTITMATGGVGGAYTAFGRRYAEIVGRAGISVDVRTTSGSIENLHLLTAPSGGADIALLQGGISNARETPGVVSLGRVFVEPLWVFYREERRLDMLHQLAGRRIAIGPEGSGTRHLAAALLAENAIDASRATLSPLTGPAAAEALRAGDLDAVFLVMAPEAPLVQSLLRDGSVKLMGFAQAEAYSRLLPYLRSVLLPRGSIDLVRNIPETDVRLIAPVATVVARNTLHPAVAGLLIDAMREVHGRGGLFHQFGEYPQAIDPEFELGSDVARYYAAGPTFLKRYLPFWLATFLERILVLLIPVAGLIVPLMRILPMIYTWRIRRRLNYWYQRLKTLEADLAADADGSNVSAQRREVEQIDAAVGNLAVPVGFSEQYYTLRSAIGLVRQRVLTHAMRGHPHLT